MKSDSGKILLPAGERVVDTSQSEPTLPSFSIQEFIARHQHQALTNDFVQAFRKSTRITEPDHHAEEQLTADWPTEEPAHRHSNLCRSQPEAE